MISRGGEWLYASCSNCADALVVLSVLVVLVAVVAGGVLHGCAGCTSCGGCTGSSAGQSILLSPPFSLYIASLSRNFRLMSSLFCEKRGLVMRLHSLTQQDILCGRTVCAVWAGRLHHR